MKGFFRISTALALVGALFMSGVAGAQGYGPNTTYSDIAWSIRSPTVYPFAGYCVELKLDATANWAISPARFIVYGALNCPGYLGEPDNFTAYGAGYGTYLAGVGDVVNFVFEAANHKFFCDNLPVPGLSGNCDIYYNGNKVGSMEIVRR